MSDDFGPELSPAEQQELRRLAGFMVPASLAHRVPGADDDTIFADIVRSLGRDRRDVRAGMAMLRERTRGQFCALPASDAEEVAMAFLADSGKVGVAIGRCVLQCYYRDRRVITALGLEHRPPFPMGHTLPKGDFSLLDAVRGRGRMWRDVDGRGN